MDIKIASILVALDTSGAVSGLKAATELAKKTGAELNALYIEDTDWFEASKFSFTQQISGYTGEVVPFEEARVSRESRALASRIRNIFANVVEMTKIKYSYRSVKGVVNTELMEAATEADLVFIRRNTKGMEYGYRLGSTARYLAEGCSTPVVIWDDEVLWPPELVGICFETEYSLTVLNWTLKLGELIGRPISYLWSKSVEVPEVLKKYGLSDTERGKKMLQHSKIISDLSIAGLHHNTRVLFVVKREAIVPDPQEFLEQFSNPVLLV